jgi:hypothetical protein
MLLNNCHTIHYVYYVPYRRTTRHILSLVYCANLKELGHELALAPLNVEHPSKLLPSSAS